MRLYCIFICFFPIFTSRMRIPCIRVLLKIIIILYMVSSFNVSGLHYLSHDFYFIVHTTVDYVM